MSDRTMLTLIAVGALLALYILSLIGEVFK